MTTWWSNVEYSITKGILNLIDMIMNIALKLIGVDGFEIDGKKDTDLLTYLFNSSRIQFGFAIAAVLGTILLIIITIFAVVRTMVKEKVEDTPLSVCKKCFSNVLVMALVPFFMIIFTLVCNAFLRAMYQGLVNTEKLEISNSLFATFALNCSTHSYNELTQINWHDTDLVRTYCNLNDFDFIFSWIVGGALLICLFTSVLSLIERVISIIVLYIAAPFTIATAVVDEGQRFKAWRDMVIAKYLVCYGMLVGLVVYVMVAEVMIPDNVRFFDDGLYNYTTKALFLLGGAVSLKGVEAVIGNLVQSGAGDKAMQDQGMATAGFMHAGGKILRGITSPFRAVRGSYNFVRDTANYGLAGSVGARTGFKTSWDYNRDFALRNKEDGKNKDKNKESSGNKNEASPQGNGSGAVADAISGGSNNTGGNRNNNSPQDNATSGRNMVNNAINDAASLNTSNNNNSNNNRVK